MNIRVIGLILVIVTLAACAPFSTVLTAEPLPDPTVSEQTAEPLPAEPPEETESARILPTGESSFTPEIYQDADTGFTLKYPQGWMVEESMYGSRASGAVFTSWQHPAGQIEPMPADGSILSATFYQWDPMNDLDAYIQTRMKDAWAASGIQVLSEEAVQLAGNRRAALFTVRSEADGEEAIFLATLAGGDYLVLSGTGDLALLREIALTAELAD